MFSGGLSSTLLPGEDIETCASGPTQATPFPENEYSRKRIAFRPRSDKIQGLRCKSQGFWLQIVYEQDGYDRPDSFDMSELVNLYYIIYYDTDTEDCDDDDEDNEKSVSQNNDVSRQLLQKGYSGLPFAKGHGRKGKGKKRRKHQISPDSESSLLGTPAPKEKSLQYTVPTSNVPVATNDSDETNDSDDKTPTPYDNIILHDQFGAQMTESNIEVFKSAKTVFKNEIKEGINLFYMSINHPDKDAKIYHPYTLLNKEVQKLTHALKIIDTRNPDTETSSYLTDCLTIVRGLHVSKATTIDNVIEPLYAVCEGILWTVHNIHRVSKRVLAEMEMINIELRRRLDSTIDIKNLLRQKKNPEVSNDHIGDIVAALARCLDAKLTFTWYKHNSSVSKHLTASRKAEVEGEMYTLIQLISTTPGIRALCKK